MDSAGNIWVADYYNNRVQKLNSSGQQLCQVAGLSSPHGVGVDRNNGNVFISNLGTHNITKVDSTCAIIRGWGGPGNGNGQFNNPYGVAVDNAGNVYVADRYCHRIQKFDPTGRFISKWSSQGNGVGQVNLPWGLTFDPTGDFLYVVEQNNHRVQKFERFGFSATATPNTKTVGSGDIAAYSIEVSGISLNTLGTTVSFYVLSGLPSGTTWSFAPPL